MNGFGSSTSTLIRLNASGSAIDFTTPIASVPYSIALDNAGAAYIAGDQASGSGNSFLAKVNSDGTAGYFTTFPFNETTKFVAVDANGNVVLFSGNIVQRVDANGAPTVKTTVAGALISYALDAAGNAYVAAGASTLYSVKNSLAPCLTGTTSVLNAYNQLLNVIAPDGSIVQATYLPGGDYPGSERLAVAPNGAILVVASAGSSLTPTQTGPFPPGVPGAYYLSSFSSNASSSPAPTYSLACVGNSASFAVGSVSPGELVTLSGQGLGPPQGVAATLTEANLYPKQLANVQVTFDGAPAPLLWVQDAQINTIAPWSLTPGQNTLICVSYNGASPKCLSWTVAPSLPGVFTVSGPQAAAVNQDGIYNSFSNPAPLGSIVSISATGLGPITPVPPDGSLIGFPLPADTLPAGVSADSLIGTTAIGFSVTPLEVLYAGPAPTFVAGVSQINFRVNQAASFGALYLKVGSATSPAFSVYVATH